MIIYRHLKRKGGTSHMIKFIKKVLVAHQDKQAQQSRIDNNHKNINSILQGLEMRGY